MHTYALCMSLSLNEVIEHRTMGYFTCLLVDINLWVMLTCALRAQVKDLKLEIKNKFYVEM